MDYIILYIICLAFGVAGAWVIARLGNRFLLLDISNHRSSHEGVVPKGGGVGLLAVFVFVSLFLKMPLAFWRPASVLALFSLLGDRMEMSPKIRLPVQFIAALIFVLLLAFSPQVSVSFFLFTIFFTLFVIFFGGFVWINYVVRGKTGKSK